jgi:hypothetical protein
MSESNEQAVLVTLDGKNLPDEIYQSYDVATLEDALSRVLGESDSGEFDGAESGPFGTTLYMYGADAERLYRTIEPILREYPLAKGARVSIRRGGPGAKESVIDLPA